MIAMEDCIDRHLYRIKSRNLDYGVYREEVKGFTGIREKFGSLYLFTEFHHDTGSPYGTVSPQEDLGLCPLENILEGTSYDNHWHENAELFSWLEANTPT